MAIEILPFSKEFDRQDFDCGTPELNRYLQEHLSQDVKRFYATVFLAVDHETKKIAGYYTLASASVDLSSLPQELTKKLPKYPVAPAIRLGRLAVDISAQGTGLGTKLMADAVLRSISNVAGWAFLLVDAKDESAVRFYKKFGFAALSEDEKHLFMMRRSIMNFLDIA